MSKATIRISRSPFIRWVLLPAAFALGLMIVMLWRFLGFEDSIKAPLRSNGSPATAASDTEWREFTGRTAYGDQYRFSIRYPDSWTLGESRGVTTLFLGECRILLGSGGSVGDGWKLITEEALSSGPVDGIRETYQHYAYNNTYLVITAFRMHYQFRLLYTTKDSTCFEDYKAIIATLELIE